MDRYLIDTSSWRMLTRYFQPYDEYGLLYKCLEKFSELGIVLIHEAVLEEGFRIKNSSKDKFTKVFDFLSKSKAVINKTPSEAWIMASGIETKLNGEWIYPRVSRRKTKGELRQARRRFTNSADFHLIYHALQHKEPIILVTEESRISNDRKPYKKIPMICDQEGIACMDIVEFLSKVGIGLRIIKLPNKLMQ